MVLPPHPIFIALQFLTVIPITLKSLPRDEDMGRSMLYYPLVGAIIGTVLAIFAFGITSLSTPSTVPLIAALTLIVWVLITGALHLDGLADSVDALVGGFGDRQRTLEIMKDPTSGPMGVVALILVLLVKFTALWLLIAAQNWQGVLIAPLIGRSALIALFLSTPYVRKGGLGALISEHMPRQSSMIILAGALALVATIVGFSTIWLLLVGAGVFAISRVIMMARLGGTTGDGAGALAELIEMSVLVTMVFARV